jgi:hypothetical protein
MADARWWVVLVTFERRDVEQDCPTGRRVLVAGWWHRLPMRRLHERFSFEMLNIMAFA